MLKSTIKHLFHQFGLEISRYNPAQSNAAQLIKMLSAHDINLVIDVGANVGQFGKLLREVGYKNQIVSFEPLLNEWEQLIKTSQNDPLWEVGIRTAIGDVNDEININIANNSQSSSVLAMLESHSAASPESKYISTELVPIRTLDSVALNYIDSSSVTLIKIDTQGYEDRVLAGATNTLSQVDGLQLELSLVPLYQDQKLYDVLIHELSSLGFKLWAITPVFTDNKSGRLLQIDATFFRN